MALSRFGMSPEQFLEITPIEFYLALKDREQTNEQKVDPICQAIRYEAWWLVNLWLPKNKKIRDPKRIFQIASDDWKAKSRGVQTPEQMKQVFKAIAGATKDRKGKKRRKPKRGPTTVRIPRMTMEDYQKAVNRN